MFFDNFFSRADRERVLIFFYNLSLILTEQYWILLQLYTIKAKVKVSIK
jgi:hypothetical protein